MRLNIVAGVPMDCLKKEKVSDPIKSGYLDLNLEIFGFLGVDFKTLLTQSLSPHKISHSDHHPRQEYLSNLENKEIPHLNCF